MSGRSGNPPRSWLRFAAQPLYRSLETSVHPLRYLFAEITQRCNLACRHCGSDCGRDPTKDELTTAEWLALFSTLSAQSPKAKPLVVLTGGEPLCHPEIDILTQALGANHLPWSLVTNGYHATKRRIQRLTQHGLRSATVSLDGMRGSHDWLRGRRGSYAKALAAIEAFVAEDLPFFDVVTCVHPGNLSELPDTFAILRERGVSHWRLFSIFPKGRAQQHAELSMSPEHYQAMLEFVREYRRQDTGAGPRVTLGCEGYLPPRMDRQVRDEPYFCRAGISIASILCDGSISACPNISRDLVQGSIRTNSLIDVWEQRFERYRDRTWMRRNECRDCSEWKRCRGNSMHLWDEQARRTAYCTFAMARADTVNTHCPTLAQPRDVG